MRIIKKNLAIWAILFLTACSRQPQNISVNVAQDAQGYVAGEDAQYVWNIQGGLEARLITACDDSVYFFESTTHLLYVYDTQTNMSIPLCNRPNCKHQSKQCNAYFEDIFAVSFLQYYDGYLYMTGVGYETYNEVNLYRISLDGTNRQKMLKILDMEGTSAYDFVIHRGYAYYSVQDMDILSDEAAQVYRYCLTGEKEPELLQEISDGYATWLDITAYGNHVYIESNAYQDNEANESYGALYQIDIHTEECKLLFENQKYSYLVVGEHLYRQNGTQLLCFNLSDGTETAILDVNGIGYIYTDDKYLYFDNQAQISVTPDTEAAPERIIYAISYEDNEVHEITLEKTTSDILGGFDGKIFAYMPLEVHSNIYTWYVTDQEDFIAGEDAFTCISYDK